MKLTCILWNGDAIHASTARIPRTGEFWWYSDGPHVVGESVYVHDEGVTWIRGYHELDSDAVSAMKAAKAMSVSR